MKMIQWPLVDGENNLYLATEWRADDCLHFKEDGTIHSNGSPVARSEITEDQVELLPDTDQSFVRDFLARYGGVV